jgi:hypothetical protein
MVEWMGRDVGIDDDLMTCPPNSFSTLLKTQFCMFITHSKYPCISRSIWLISPRENTPCPTTRHDLFE